MAKINLIHQSIPGLDSGEYYDTNTKGKGLILRVLKSGTRRFEYRYRSAGKNIRYHIGEFPDTSLSDARKALQKLKGKVIQGIDPQAEREQIKRERELKAQTAKTFKDLVDRYKNAEFPLLRQATKKEYQRIIDEELLPVIGKYRVQDITTKQIRDLLDKKAFDDGSPVMANRIRSRLHTIFEFAVGRYISENPVSDTTKYKGESTGKRTYTENEIRKLWKCFDTCNEPMRSYLKIITLTGQRRTETLHMKWENIQYMDDNDLKGWVWVIPAELSKSSRTHEVPLTEMALDIIESLKPRASQNPYVFSSFHGNGKPISLKTVKRVVKQVKEGSEVTDFKLHDVRRTVSTQLAKIGVAQEVASKILNHKSGSGGALAKIYNRHEYRPERQKALRQWEMRLHQILNKETATIHKIGVGY